MGDYVMMLSWMAGLFSLVFLAYCIPVFGESWKRIKEYEEMRARGFTLMKSEDGDDFWVGYGD